MSSVNWFNQNANRAYPFLDGTTGQPVSGPVTLRQLPDATVLDVGFVLGVHARFHSASHRVYLARVRRLGTWFYFDFESDAPELNDVPLSFARQLGETYVQDRSDSGELGLSNSSLSGSVSLAEACTEPLWYGFLTTGVLDELAVLLPADGELTHGTGDAVVEPSLLQNLSDTYVAKVGVANDDRTRVSRADGCPDIVFPYPTGVLHVYTPCLVGDLRFKPGYNCRITQSAQSNSVTFAAIVGAGEGQPCAPVPLFDGESAPDGSALLEGGPRCNEVLRSINGIGGSVFNIHPGLGVNVESDPENHRVIVDVSLSGLALRFDNVSRSSESC